MNVSTQIILIALVVLAGWSDFKTRRIPNWIPVSGAMLGLILQTWFAGLTGLLMSLAGIGAGLAVFLPLYILGGMGAGDVKLFAAIGALVQPQSLIIIFVFTALLGGMAAVCLAASRGRLLQTLRQTGVLMLDLGRLRFHDARELGADSNALRLPYGVVIAAGTLLSLIVVH